MPSGSFCSSMASGATTPLTRRLWAADPGVELKSPHTAIGMSADAEIFSRPLRSVCTCQSLTSLSSGLEWMCVLAMQMSCLLDCSCPVAPACPSPTLRRRGGTSASSTAISATLSLSSLLSAAVFCSLGIASARDSAALLNSTSYFLTRANFFFLKNVAQPSIAYVSRVYISFVLRLKMAVYPARASSGAKKSVKWVLCTSWRHMMSALYESSSRRRFARRYGHCSANGGQYWNCSGDAYRSARTL
mmetsp:Transcript_1707/g.5692  ORF Transcript_1707/g.5692 Transcript_1707/m.5692 type:complete len:246 (-) Transcript_1707:905-1642(-)